MVTSATTIKNERHDDDVARLNGQTDADLHSARKIEAGNEREKEERKRTYQS